MVAVIGNIHLSNAESGWGYQLRAVVSPPLFSLTSMSIAYEGGGGKPVTKNGGGGLKYPMQLKCIPVVETRVWGCVCI